MASPTPHPATGSTANAPPRTVAPNQRHIDAALTFALAVRDGDPMAIAEGLATGTPAAMMLTLAALIHVDEPVDRWWDGAVREYNPAPCRWCEEPLGRRSHLVKSPYHELCRREARRQTWRDSRERRAAQLTRATLESAS